MASKEPLFDLSTLDLTRVLVDREGVNAFNEQRFEMQQLDGILYQNEEEGIAIGYKDLTDNEFWIRGHMPGSPLMPGVLMCEAAAQLCSYFGRKMNLTDREHIIGFAGLDDVRFRGIVVPGDKLIVIIKRVKMNRLLLSCDFQCYVDNQLVCNGNVKGAPVPRSMISQELEKK